MIVKSKQSVDHINHLKESFDILRQYRMMLNPTKCSFWVKAEKFLGTWSLDVALKEIQIRLIHRRDQIPMKP